jgi:hypothetical protein
MRLIVARCEVTYTGRLSAYLPESTRLLMVKDDGAVLVHADAGGYKPLKGGTPVAARTKLASRKGGKPACNPSRRGGEFDRANGGRSLWSQPLDRIPLRGAGSTRCS